MKRMSGWPGAFLSLVFGSFGYFLWGWRCGIAATLALVIGCVGGALFSLMVLGTVGSLAMSVYPLVPILSLALYHIILSKKNIKLVCANEEALLTSGVQEEVSRLPAINDMIQKAYARYIALLIFADLLLCTFSLFIALQFAYSSLELFLAGNTLMGAVWLAPPIVSVAAMILASKFITKGLVSSFSQKLRGVYGRYATLIQP